MSRSRKYTPIHATTNAKSEKEDKQRANRKDRRVNKVILQTTEDEEKLLEKRATSNVYDFAKDGKIRTDSDNKNLRK